MDRTPLSKRQHNVPTPRKGRTALDKNGKPGTPAAANDMTKSSFIKKLVKCSAATGSEENDSQKISVSVRVRPPPASLVIGQCDYSCISKSGENEIHVRTNQTKDAKENYLVFSYDHVFWFEDDDVKGSDQSNVFQQTAIPLLNCSIEGYNSCLFAYGQTGSGKTYSLMDADGQFSEKGMGVIPRFCKELIIRRDMSKDFDINVSYYEIYHEKIYDLLTKDGTGESRPSLKVREHPLSGPYVAELTSVRVRSFPEVLALISLGNGRRVTGATLHNERSSRSHTIFDISLHRSEHEQSKVRLVDLAGSERVSQCAVTEERFREGLSINKSLLTLGKVITALAETKKRVYVPYRESVLTWLLRDSLGGHARTCMLATVSPAPGALEETLSTLRWAHKARTIVCTLTKNEDPQIRLIVDLQNEVKRLRALRSDMSGGSPRDSLSEMQQLQAKLELEQRQKSAESRLQAELAKLEQHLNEAEKRKSELETQREVILQEASEHSIPSYKSNFYDNLKNILDCSMNESISDIMKEDVVSKVKSTSQLKEKYLHKMMDLTECLQSIYIAEISTHSVTSDSSLALSLMNEIQERLNKIITL